MTMMMTVPMATMAKTTTTKRQQHARLSEAHAARREKGERQSRARTDALAAGSVYGIVSVNAVGAVQLS
jgi:hypothetical protein